MATIIFILYALCTTIAALSVDLGSKSIHRVDIPASTSTVSVSIIDSGARFSGLPFDLFYGPPLKGIHTFQGSDYGFLIEHVDQQGKSKKIIFDLGPAIDWRIVLGPSATGIVQDWVEGGATLDIPNQMYDILKSNHVNLTADDLLIWSHPHWDHMGKVSLFPSEVSLLVGPGVISNFSPGYPTNPNSPWLTSELEGRQTIELSFNETCLEIGGLQAIDHFGDGSFYLLNAPGHCTGQVNALARVSDQEFIFLAGDSFFSPSMIRPTRVEALPREDEKYLAAYPSLSTHQHDHYTSFLQHTNPGHTPFLTVGWSANGTTIASDPTEARQTIDKVKLFDADERVFVISAHDHTLLQVVNFFPEKANNWKEAGWKHKARWDFLSDLEPAL